jgi:hypothetical protein
MLRELSRWEKNQTVSMLWALLDATIFFAMTWQGAMNWSGASGWLSYHQ